jgi:hypothetical protein
MAAEHLGQADDSAVAVDEAEVLLDHRPRRQRTKLRGKAADVAAHFDLLGEESGACLRVVGALAGKAWLAFRGKLGSSSEVAGHGRCLQTRTSNLVRGDRRHFHDERNAVSGGLAKGAASSYLAGRRI